MRDQQCSEAEGVRCAENGRRRDKQQHHGNAGHDIRIHHGDIGHGLHRAPEPALAHGVQPQRPEGTDDRGDQRRTDGKYHRIAQGGQRLLVREQLAVPFQRHAGEGRETPALVEGEYNQHKDGYIQQEEDETDINTGECLHITMPPSSLSVKRFMMHTETIISTIMISDMVAPTP